ncbi:hypothetical protein J7K42_01835 [bacterium]|nr:hypothetical protein [bacterium]
MEEFLKKVDQLLAEKEQQKQEVQTKEQKRTNLLEELIERAEKANAQINLTADFKGIGKLKMRVRSRSVDLWDRTRKEWIEIIPLPEKAGENSIQYFASNETGAIGRILQAALDGKATVKVE